MKCRKPGAKRRDWPPSPRVRQSMLGEAPMKMREWRPLLAALWLVAASAETHAQPAAAEVVSVQGQGESRPDERAAWKPAEAKQELFARSFVRTGPLSRMGLLFQDRTQVRLAEKTVLQIKEAPSRRDERTVLRLEQGRSWSQTNSAPSNLYLETPSATAAIRGTDWEVEVFEGGRSLLTVLSGEVTFFNPLGSVTVTRNEQAQAIPGQAPTKLLIANPRDRVQWVTAYVVVPERHIDGSRPSEEVERLHRIASDVRGDRLEAALSAALREMEGRPSQPAAWLIASDLMVQQGRIDRAMDHVQQGLERFPAHPLLVAQGARIGLASGDFAAAEARLASAPGTFETRLVAADLARARGDALAARAGYEAARADRPRDDRPWAGIGIVDSEREAVRSARYHLAEAVKLDPRHERYQGDLGTLETFANRFQEADRAFRAALEANPADYVALTGRGLLELKRGQPGPALESFLRAATLEPRFARARMYAAVAQYQLGHHALALRELRRAAELDDKDPLPHLYASMILTDLYRIEEATEESRIAMRLLPYLKSLNQVANDLQGSANLGRAFALFGLEEWAQSRAQESYLPYWAGSHLFLADRYVAPFNKNSALLQGFLTDPTVFGASTRFQTLVPSLGHYGRALLGYAYSEDAKVGSPIGRVSGLAYPGMPVAYLIDADWKRFDIGGDRSDAKVVTAALGARPTHELSLFLYGFDSRNDGELHSGSVAYDQDQRTRVVQVGASYRFSPTSQAWLRAGRVRDWHREVGFIGGDAFTQDLTLRQPEYGLRHTMDLGRHQVSWGVEQSHKELDTVFATVPFQDAVINTTLRFDERSRNAYVSDTWDVTPAIRLQADAWWQDSRRLLDRSIIGYVGDIPVPGPMAVEDLSERKTTARLGARVKLTEAVMLRAAWQDWVRPVGTSTLGPLATAGIPMDDRIVARGGHQRRERVQLEAETSARTFWTLFADRKRIDNRRFSYSPFFISEDENLSKVRLFDYAQLGAEDLYEFISAPEFDGARITIAGAALNHVISPTWSLRARYEHTNSENTGEAFNGKRIAFLPPHAASIGATWMSPWRIYMTQRAVYRTRRFVDEANLVERAPGWDLSADWFWETADKRWRVRFSLDNVLHKERHTLYTLVLVASF